MTRASRFLAALDACLPVERFQHGRVTRAAETVQDTDGRIGFPFLAEGTLGLLQRKGEISEVQLQAGSEFSRWFYLAALDPLRAGDLAQRLEGKGTYSVAITEHARRRINAALDALGGLGSPCGSVSWHCLGMQLTIAQWAKREGWSGRPVRHESAKLVLAGALSVLVAHYRIGPAHKGT